MNPQGAIIAKLESSTALMDLLLGLPGDPRTTPVYPVPILRKDTPDAFLDTAADVVRPAIYVTDGGGATTHPQAWKISYLTALYPEVWVYAPTLPGINGVGIVHSAVQQIRSLLDELYILDPDTNLGGRIGWMDDLGGRMADEYVSTYMDRSRFQYRARWRED